jgi:hypothetical protein
MGQSVHAELGVRRSKNGSGGPLVALLAAAAAPQNVAAVPTGIDPLLTVAIPKTRHSDCEERTSAIAPGQADLRL